MQHNRDIAFDYTILGAGAVGSVIGGQLAQAGFRVQLITTSNRLGAAIADGGLRLELDTGLQVSHPAATTAQHAKPATHVILLTKTYHSESALRALAPVVSAETVLTSLQNGVGNGALLRTNFPENPVLHGVTMLPATLLSPGHIRSLGPHVSSLGPLDPKDLPHAEALANDLNKAGIKAEVLANPEPQIWAKACFNIALNAVNALTGGGPGLIPEVAELPQLVRDITLEAISVARAEGVDLNPEEVFAKIDFACREHRFHRPSMLQDVTAKRRTEIDAMNGRIVQLADRHGLDVPMNRLLTGLIHGVEQAERYWAGMPD